MLRVNDYCGKESAITAIMLIWKYKLNKCFSLISLLKAKLELSVNKHCSSCDVFLHLPLAVLIKYGEM